MKEKKTFILTGNAAIRFIYNTDIETHNGIRAEMETEDEAVIVFSDEDKQTISMLHVTNDLATFQLHAAIIQELAWFDSFKIKPNVDVCSKRSKHVFVQGVVKAIKSYEKQVGECSQRFTESGTLCYEADAKNFVTDDIVSNPQEFPHHFSVYYCQRNLVQPDAVVKALLKQQNFTVKGLYEKALQSLYPKVTLLYDPEQNIKLSEVAMKKRFDPRLSSLLFAIKQGLPDRTVEEVDEAMTKLEQREPSVTNILHYIDSRFIE